MNHTSTTRSPVQFGKNLIQYTHHPELMKEYLTICYFRVILDQISWETDDSRKSLAIDTTRKFQKNLH